MDNSLQKNNAGSKLDQWSKRVAACRSSGMPVKTWCAQEGVSEKTYYYWRRKVFMAAQKQEEGFVEVTGGSYSQSGVAATIQTRGFSVEVHNGADRETLIALMQVIGSC